MCAGLYPNIIVVEPPASPAGEPKLTTRHGDVFLHPSTVSFGKKQLGSRFLMYHEKVKTTKVYVRDSRCGGPSLTRCVVSFITTLTRLESDGAAAWSDLDLANIDVC